MTRGIKRSTRIAALAAASALVLTACGGGGGGSDSPSSMSKNEIYQAGIVGVSGDAGTPKAGGTLTIADYSEAKSLDPAVTIPNGAAGGNALAAVYDVLVRYDSAKKEFVPELAESLTSTDNKVWTIKLRKDVKFSDGTPLDAMAVVTSIGRYMKNRGYNTLILATNIADMKPTGADTVVITLRKPWRSFPNMLAGGPGMIVAPAAYKDPKNFKPIGAGPFTLENYKPGEEMLLVANPNYWAGAPSLEKLRFVWMPSDADKYAALKDGTIDVMYVRNPKTLEESRKAGYAGIMTPVGLGSMLWINNREGRAGSDVRIREAINLAIDPKVYADRTNDGAGLPGRNIFSPTSRFYTDVKTADVDVAKAKSLVDAAKKDGFNGKLTYIGQSDPQSQAGAVTIQGMLERAGFEVKVEGLRDIADQTKRIYITHDYDLAVSALSVQDEDPYSRFATNLQTGSLQSPNGYSDKEMDGLIDQLQNADGADEKAVLEKINERWQATYPGVALAAGAFFEAWNKDVHGIVPAAETMMLFGQAWKG